MATESTLHNKTEYELGKKIPLVYGERVIDGLVVSQYVSYNTDFVYDVFDTNIQYDDEYQHVWYRALKVSAQQGLIHTQLLLSHGEIEGIRKKDDSGNVASRADTPWIKIDDAWFDPDQRGAYWDYKLGTSTQTALHATRAGETIADGQKLNSSAWHTITDISSGDNINQFILKVNFPNGCRDPRFSRYLGQINHVIQYKTPTGGGTWQDFAYPTAGMPAGKTWLEGLWSNSEEEFDLYYNFDGLTVGTYDVRIRVDSNTTIYDQHVLSDGTIVENTGVLESYDIFTELSQPRYRGYAMVYLRTPVAATENLEPEIRIKINGKKVQAYDGTSWATAAYSRNPAWCIHDLIMDSTYGLGEFFECSPESDAKFLLLANLCDTSTTIPGGSEDYALCDYMIDGSDPDPIKIIENMLRACSATPVITGSNFYPNLARSNMTPSYMMGMGDISDKGLSETWGGYGTTPNYIEIEYFEAGLDNDADIVRYPEDGTITGMYDSSEKIRKETITFKSVSRRTEAMRIAKRIFLENKHQDHSVSLVANEESLAIQPGDIFYLSHDDPQFGYSGAIERVLTSTQIELDNYYDTIDLGSYSYRLLVQRKSDDAISSIATVTGCTTANQRHRVTFSGLGWTPTIGDKYLIVRYVAGAAVLAEYFCTKISRESDGSRKVSAVEYHSECYDPAISDFDEPNPSDLPSPNAVPGDPTNLNVKQFIDSPNIRIVWTDPSGYSYSYTKVWVNGIEIARTTSGSVDYLNVLIGNTYFIRVVTYNRYGVPCVTPATMLYTISGGTPGKPPIVTGLEIEGQANNSVFDGKHCKISWNLAGTTGGIGRDPMGQEGVGLGQHHAYEIQDTMVQVYTTGGVLLRTTYVPYPQTVYTYTLEMNSEDNGGTPAISFIFKLWFRDRYNQMSDLPAMLSVTNAVPDMPSGLTYDFEGKDLKIYWDNSAETDHDYHSLTLNSGTAKKVKDNTYIYTFEENLTQNAVADPTIQIALRDVDLYGQESSPNNTTGTNPAPSQPTNLELIPWATGMGINWDKGPETDLLKYQYKTRVSSASWSGWVDETGCSFVRQLTQAEMDTYGAAAYISVEVRAMDWFLQYSTVAAGGNTCLTISEIQLAGEIFQIAPTDSYGRNVTTLKGLYNGDYTTAAASYLTGSWVQFAFPVDYVFSGVNLWDVDISPGYIYFSYSQDGTSWSYIKAESDHTLDSANRLLTASSQADAITNYWSVPANSKSSAYFPNHVQARYVRMHCAGPLGPNLAELKFNTLVVADEIICFTLSAIVANLGDVNIGNVSGGDGSVTCYNSSAQKTIEMTTAGNLSTFRASTGAEICRLGNLNGFLGYTSTTDGIAIGDSDDFFKYDLTSGIRMSCGSGGSLKILAGGDITLNGHSTNPGRINFEGSTYTAAMGLNTAGTLFEIIPVTDNAIGLQIGNILGGWPSTAARRFTGIIMASRNHVSLAAVDTAAGGYPYAGLTLYSGSSTEHATMDIGISGSSYGKYGWYYDSYRPGTDGKLSLGTSTYRWKECHSDIYCGNGSNNAASLQTLNAGKAVSFSWNGTASPQRLYVYINGVNEGWIELDG